MDSKKVFQRRNRDINTKPLTRFPTFASPLLDFNTDSSSSSSSEEFPKLFFEKRSSLRKINSLKSTTLKKKVSFNSNQVNLQSIEKKQQKSKFYTIQNPISNSKIKSLEIFEQNFDLLIDEIEKDHNRRARSKSTILLNKPRYRKSNTEEKIISLTNMEMISDFYEYTENCMKLITDLIPKDKQSVKIPPRNFNFVDNLQRKKIAIFDLDETLIHCVGDIRKKKKNEYQQVISVTMPTRTKVQIGINIRPHWKKSLLQIKDKYFIVAYTASHNNYADAVLDFLDPDNNIFEARLYRKDCIFTQVEESKFYIKDLEIFKNFDLKDIVLIDNSVLSFAYHLNNGIPIVPYYDSVEDSELIILSKYLLFIADCDDLRECNKEHINMESFLEQAKKEKMEEGLSNSSNEEEEDEKEEESNVEIVDVVNNENKEINIDNITLNDNDKSNNKLIFINSIDNNVNNDNKLKNNQIKCERCNNDNLIFVNNDNVKRSSSVKHNFQRKMGKIQKLRTHVVQKRISICDDDFSLNFSREESKIQAPKNFKRRNRTIRYKLQTMMNQMHKKFVNTIINVAPRV